MDSPFPWKTQERVRNFSQAWNNCDESVFLLITSTHDNLNRLIECTSPIHSTTHPVNLSTLVSRQLTVIFVSLPCTVNVSSTPRKCVEHLNSCSWCYFWLIFYNDLRFRFNRQHQPKQTVISFFRLQKQRVECRYIEHSCFHNDPPA